MTNPHQKSWYPICKFSRPLPSAEQGFQRQCMNTSCVWCHDIEHYWLARGMHQLPVESPNKGPVMQSFDDVCVIGLSRLLNHRIVRKLRGHDAYVMSLWCEISLWRNVNCMYDARIPPSPCKLETLPVWSYLRVNIWIVNNCETETNKQQEQCFWKGVLITMLFFNTNHIRFLRGFSI